MMEPLNSAVSFKMCLSCGQQQFVLNLPGRVAADAPTMDGVVKWVLVEFGIDIQQYPHTPVSRTNAFF